MFSIVSFNIWNVWRLTRRAWNRDDLAAEVIRDLFPDVLCLQEFDGPFRHEEVSLPQMLSPDYAEVPVADVPPDDNWNPIFYRAERFRAVAGGHHVYSAGTEYPYREKYRSHFRTFTWGVLEARESGALCAVVNTHYDTDQSNLKSESDELIAVCLRLERDYRCPVLVAGDYNCVPAGVAVQNMLSNGFRDTCPLAKHREEHMGCHPYPILNEEKQIFDRYDAHFYHTAYKDAIDHILLLGEAEVERYRTVMNEKTFLISDHSPVLVEMTFPTARKI